MMRCEISVNYDSRQISLHGWTGGWIFVANSKKSVFPSMLRTYGQLRTVAANTPTMTHPLLDLPYFSFFFVVVPDVQTYLILILHVYQYIYIATILLISYFTMP